MYIHHFPLILCPISLFDPLQLSAIEIILRCKNYWLSPTQVTPVLRWMLVLASLTMYVTNIVALYDIYIYIYVYICVCVYISVNCSWVATRWQ